MYTYIIDSWGLQVRMNFLGYLFMHACIHSVNLVEYSKQKPSVEANNNSQREQSIIFGSVVSAEKVLS